MAILKPHHTQLSVDIPSVILMDIEGASNITLTATAPSPPGSPIIFGSNNSVWINYTYIKSASDKTATISASISTLAGFTINALVASSFWQFKWRRSRKFSKYISNSIDLWWR